MPYRPSLETQDWYALHEIALQIHRSATIIDACRHLSAFLITNSLACEFRTSVCNHEFSSRFELLTLPFGSSPLPEESPHLIRYDFKLPSHDFLRIEISLLPDSCERDRTLIEILCEHLCITCTRIPLRNFPGPTANQRVTQREAEILPYLLAGRTNPEIGIILGISPRTVEKHVAALLRKHDCETRIDLLTAKGEVGIEQGERIS